MQTPGGRTRSRIKGGETVNPEKDLMSTPINEFVDEFLEREIYGTGGKHFPDLVLEKHYQKLFDELIPKHSCNQ